MEAVEIAFTDAITVEEWVSAKFWGFRRNNVGLLGESE